MAGSGAVDARSLEETSTWAVAVVCFALVIISVIIEHPIHLIGQWVKKRDKRPLYEALEKIKSELMLLGFVSLLLTVGQGPISSICVAKSVGNSWHPCDPKDEATAMSNEEDESHDPQGTTGRRLLHTESFDHFRRILAGGEIDKCAAKNKVPFVSSDGIHQLQIFIFVLAVFHVVYCISTMALGRLKMRRWKSWELEAKTAEYVFSHHPDRFRFARDTSFGRRHLGFWRKSPILIWIVCFFRQFVRSVPKVDYLTLRHGFIMVHLAPESSTKFNFQKYIKRSLEEDSQIVVGISPTMWFFAVLFLLLSTHGLRSYLWLPFIPLIIILLVGTKLQVIITRMAIQIMERGEVVRGVPIVRPTDDLFWFNRPDLLLYLIHFVLFQNAFQLAFFAWSWYEFGYPSCFHKHMRDIIIRISMGILIQILCGYATLPLYALVTQMGSNMKPAIFNERVAAGLRKWHRTSRKHLKNRRSGNVTPSSTRRPATPNHGLSPVHLLRHYRSQASPRRCTIDHGQFYLKESPSSSHHTINGSSFFHREQGKVDGGTEMQELGDSAEQQLPHDIDSNHGAGISIDFSFDKREIIIE